MGKLRRIAAGFAIASVGIFSLWESIAQTATDAVGFVQAPAITSGTVVDDTYLSGTINAGVDFRRSSNLALDLGAEFSIDGGQQWQPATFSA